MRFPTPRARAAALGLLAAPFVGHAAQRTLTETERGVVVETDRYRVTMADGVVVGCFNKLTGEEYLNLQANPGNILPYLPSGLGTIHGSNAYLAARGLMAQPWWEHSYKDPLAGYQATNFWAWFEPLYRGGDTPGEHRMYLPNQHRVTPASRLKFVRRGPTSAVLTYEGLSDGRQSYPDESFGLEVEVDAETGDLVLTPTARSPRGGVYGAALTVSACAPGISMEAPIWDGIRIRHEAFPTSLWHNANGYWDYAFVALNGFRTGAVGIWLEDPEVRYYRSLFYLNNEEGLSFSMIAFTIPPFEQSREARTASWRLQAFDKSWAQAAARFRERRARQAKLAPRPEWARHLSFVLSGPDQPRVQWADLVNAYFENRHLERVIVWATMVRRMRFDDAHWDNRPYDGFKADMEIWKRRTRARVMPYLQPMIVWERASTAPPEAAWIMDMHREANTQTPEHAAFPRPQPLQQHNLAHVRWTDWFLKTWVNRYLQDFGADGIYHDQTTYCPIDRRPPDETFGGRTALQGMANYFYRAQVENPESVHASEHLWEANSSGGSLGIGSDIHWGAGAMRELRVRYASPVTAALHPEPGVIFSFPHQSDFAQKCDVVLAHQGMNLMERRSQIAGTPIVNIPLYSGDLVPFQAWVNELGLIRQRDTTFVHRGLRPIFPEHWDRSVLSYFRGAAGEDFRYVETPWGSAFVELQDGRPLLHYGRVFATGVRSAAFTEGSIFNWACFCDRGPTGLHPQFAYCVSPRARRPSAYFTPETANGELRSSFVARSCSDRRFVALSIQPLPESSPEREALRLVSPQPAKAIYRNGEPVPSPLIEFIPPAEIVAILEEPPAGLKPIAHGAVLCMVMPGTVHVDLFDPAWLSSKFTVAGEKDDAIVLGQSFIPHFRTHLFERHVLWKAPANGALTFKSERGTLRRLIVNGAIQPDGSTFTAGEGDLLWIRTESEAAMRLTLRWKPGAPADGANAVPVHRLQTPRPAEDFSGEKREGPPEG